MFKLIASSYGEGAQLVFFNPHITIKGFNEECKYTHKVQKSLDVISDSINITQDLLSVEVITEEDHGRKKFKGAALAVAGAALLGPVGVGAYFMGGKKEFSTVRFSTKKGGRN